MKKTYLQPKSVIVNVKVKSTILEGSLQKFDETTVSGNKGGWTNRDNGWDIWGNDADDDFDE